MAVNDQNIKIDFFGFSSFLKTNISHKTLVDFDKCRKVESEAK